MAEFAAGAGHEINNPLAVISGREQLCMKNEADPQRRRDLSLISAQAMRIYEMIADMRLFARPPGSRRDWIGSTPAICFARPLIAELSPIARHAQQTKISAVELPGGARLEIYGDAKQLQCSALARAICQNKPWSAFAGRRQVLRFGISARHTNRFVEITIADNGPGILPEQRPHIFDPYYSARQAGRGLGMGLVEVLADRAQPWRTNRVCKTILAAEAIFTIRLPSQRVV